jgi:hypothetical protein
MAGSHNYGAGQSHLSEYAMPSVAGRIPSSNGPFASAGAGSSANLESTSPGASSASTGSGRQSWRNQQTNPSLESSTSTTPTATTTTNPVSTNRNNNGGYEYGGNQNNQNQYYRQLQMQRLYDQELAQQAWQNSLYYNSAVSPYYSNYQGYDNSGYDYGSSYDPSLQGDPSLQTGYTQAPTYQPGSGYDNGQLAQNQPLPADQGVNSSPDAIYRPVADPGAGTNLSTDGQVPQAAPGPSYDRLYSRSGDRSDRVGPATQGDASGSAGGWSQYDFAVYNHLKEQAQALVGHSIQEFDKSVPVRLGCARAVSLLVNKGYGFPVTDQSIANLEQSLRKDGFTEVSIKDMKPGDVICGYRKAGDYPHGAVYMGNGMIFNNDSDSGVMQIQSIAKYNKADFKRFVILHRPDSVPAVAADAYATGRSADSGYRQGTPDQTYVASPYANGACGDDI